MTDLKTKTGNAEKRLVTPKETRCEMTQIVMPRSPNVYYIGKTFFLLLSFCPVTTL